MQVYKQGWVSEAALAAIAKSLQDSLMPILHRTETNFGLAVVGWVG